MQNDTCTYTHDPRTECDVHDSHSKLSLAKALRYEISPSMIQTILVKEPHDINIILSNSKYKNRRYIEDPIIKSNDKKNKKIM